MVICHTRRVVDGQHDLVLSLARFGPSEPDLVLSELTGDIRDHFPHIKTFASTIITPKRKKSGLTSRLFEPKQITNFLEG